MAAPATTTVSAMPVTVVTAAVVADPDVHGRPVPAAATIAAVVLRGRVAIVVVVRIAGVIAAGITAAHVGIAGIDATREREDRETDQYSQEFAHGELHLLACKQPRATRFNAR